LLIERLMWGTDWDDRLTALLTSRQPARSCAACDRPVDGRPSHTGEHVLCAQCEATPDAA
jgi:hypothetical protein